MDNIKSFTHAPVRQTLHELSSHLVSFASIAALQYQHRSG
jgi:hypothetical protein